MTLITVVVVGFILLLLMCITDGTFSPSTVYTYRIEKTPGWKRSEENYMLYLYTFTVWRFSKHRHLESVQFEDFVSIKDAEVWLYMKYPTAIPATSVFGDWD